MKFYYRYSKNQLPRYFDNMFTPILVTHLHDTRHRCVPRHPLPLRASTKNCTRYYIPAILNESPQNITEKITTHSYYGFSNYIKTLFINQYSKICTIANCFVCNNWLTFICTSVFCIILMAKEYSRFMLSYHRWPPR